MIKIWQRHVCFGKSWFWVGDQDLDELWEGKTGDLMRIELGLDRGWMFQNIDYCSLYKIAWNQEVQGFNGKTKLSLKNECFKRICRILKQVGWVNMKKIIFFALRLFKTNFFKKKLESSIIIKEIINFFIYFKIFIPSFQNIARHKVSFRYLIFHVCNILIRSYTFKRL